MAKSEFKKKGLRQAKLAEKLATCYNDRNTEVSACRMLYCAARDRNEHRMWAPSGGREIISLSQWPLRYDSRSSKGGNFRPDSRDVRSVGIGGRQRAMQRVDSYRTAV